MSNLTNKVVPAVAAIILGAIGIVPLYMAHAEKGKGITTAASAGGDQGIELKGAYAIGYQIGSGAREQIPDLNTSAFQRGFNEAYSGKKPAYKEEELQAAVMQMQESVQKKRLEKETNQIKNNAAEADAFLAKNAKKAGIKTTASGLQYEVLQAGTGKTPKASDKVTVHYEGKLLNGQVFDTSKGKAPVTFGVGEVIPGWTEGLQLMQEGGKYRLYVPAKLAYGDAGVGGTIPPGSMLIFDVELVKVAS